MARSLLLALCVALCVAAAAATGSHPSCKGVRRYQCINKSTFCNGGIAQQCPAGTTCVTQSDKNALKISPCVTRAAKHPAKRPSHKPHRPSGHPRHLLGGSHKPTHHKKPVQHKPTQHKPQQNQHHAPRCHLSNYVCTSHSRFCLGGYSMACPAGTVCRTQPRSRRQSASPCVWP